ncbi:MAG: T9SS type A sorting domain-containing protein [Bacteroidales bacterium]|nr:T9SS type A sorting domain-containing protein [Bacteroidales bacterium]MCF8455197.1 T9SS type A sorting domain-containing protein [Bacteroidales bacterium]
MMIRKIIFILCLSAALMQGGLGQVINTSVGSQTVCPGTVVVPIAVTNCNGVCGISLALGFNSQVLTYQSYQNLNPALNNGLLIINQAASKVFISWANISPANIGNDTLVKLVFSTVPGYSSLNWDTQTPGNCEFSNYSGLALAATYVNGSITVDAPPAIVNQPSDVSLIIGQGATFSVQATGTALAYQWQISMNGGLVWDTIMPGMGYTGYSSASLSFSVDSFPQSGNLFRCMVSGVCPVPVYTNAALLTVNPPPQEISVSCGSINECPGNYVVPINISNFYDVGAFSLALNYNGVLLDFTGTQNLNSFLSQGLVAINAAANKIYITWAAQNPATFSTGQELLVELLFSASGGGTGTFTWDTQTPGNCEFSSTVGSTILSTFTSSSVQIKYPPEISSQPVNATIDAGQTANFSITASGTQIFYQWQVSTNNGLDWINLTNTSGYSGATTANMHIANVSTALNGNLYRCVVEGYCSPVAISDPAMLTVIPTPQIIGLTCGNYTGCAGELIIPVTVSNFDSVGSFSLGLNFPNTLVSFMGIQNQQTVLNQGMLVANAAGNQVFISWANQTTANITPTPAVLFELIFSGNLGGTGSFSWDVSTPGNCEFSTSSGAIIQSTYTNGSLNLLQPPVITSQPQNTTKEAGQTATFSVTATGAGLWYQWQESIDNGTTWTSIGTNNHNLSLSGVSLGMNGNEYRCLVNGSCEPTDTSDIAVLTVVPATQVITVALPTITNQCVTNMSIPVSVYNFTGVGAFSFAIEFDPALLTFTGVSNLSSELSSGLLISNSISGKLFVSWASTVPATIYSSYLLYLDFISAGGTTALTFDVQTSGNCEIADGAGIPISTVYTNGSIAVSPQPLSVSAGPDLVMVPGTPVTINAAISGGTPPYSKSWSPSLGLSDTSILQPIADPLVSTLYTLEVTDNNGCTGSDDMWVIVEIIPSIGWLWSSGDGGSAEDAALCVATDLANNAIASGTFASSTLLFDTITLTNTGNNSLFIAKYGPNGEVLWARQSQNDGWTEGKAIATDVAGNIFVAGSFQSSNLEISGQLAVGHGWTDAFVAKFSPSGTLLWLQSYGGSSQDKATGIGVDGNGNVIVSGFFLSSTISFGNVTLTNTNINFADIFLLKLDTYGDIIWAKKAGGNEWDEASQIVVTPTGETYMTGYFVSPALQFPGMTLSHLGTGTPNSFLAKFNASGNALWTKKPGLSQNNYGTCVTTDSIGNVFWGGYFYDTELQLGDSIFEISGGSDVYFSKLTSSGSYLWSNQPVGTGYEQPTGIVCRNSNEIVLIGNYNSPVLTFGNQSVTGTGFYDFFLTSYNTFGSVLITKHVGSSLEDIVNGGAADGLGNVFVAGSYKSQTLMFDTWQTINANPGESDLFVAKYGATDPQLTIGANNTHPICNGDANGSIQVLVLQGMPPFSYLWGNGETGQSIGGLGAGTYSVTVIDANLNTDSLNIELIDPPFLLVSGIVTNASCSTCPDGEIQVTVNGGMPPYQFWWSTGDTSEDLANLVPGFYYASIADSYGCSVIYQDTVGGAQQTQAINLPMGWGFFSSYMDPTEPNIDSLCAPFASEVIICKNGDGLIYWPQYGLNFIGDILIGQGYQIKMASAQTMFVAGVAIIPENTPISIPLGWSFLGYLRQSPASVVTMLSPTVSDIIIIKNGAGNIYWPQFGVNMIGNMIPGEGYQIKTSAACTLTYPANTGNVSKPAIINPPPGHFGMPANTGNNMTLGIRLPDWMSGEIGMFDTEGLLVGSAMVNGDFVAITLWGDDETTPEKDGLVPGEAFTVWEYRNLSGLEKKLTGLEYLEGDGSYETNKIAIAKFVSGFEFDGLGYQLNQNVPNPFTNETDISFYLPEKTYVEFTIFNMLGEQVETLLMEEMEAGKHSVKYKTRTLQAGTYYYRLGTPGYSETRKMVIMKQ